MSLQSLFSLRSASIRLLPLLVSTPTVTKCNRISFSPIQVLTHSLYAIDNFFRDSIDKCCSPLCLAARCVFLPDLSSPRERFCVRSLEKFWWRWRCLDQTRQISLRNCHRWSCGVLSGGCIIRHRSGPHIFICGGHRCDNDLLHSSRGCLLQYAWKRGTCLETVWGTWFDNFGLHRDTRLHSIHFRLIAFHKSDLKDFLWRPIPWLDYCWFRSLQLMKVIHSGDWLWLATLSNSDCSSNERAIRLTTLV